jgi:hypothetical protein
MFAPGVAVQIGDCPMNGGIELVGGAKVRCAGKGPPLPLPHRLGARAQLQRLPNVGRFIATLLSS